MQMLLEAMRRHGVDKIVFSSTAAVYGEPRRVPIEESDLTRPAEPLRRKQADDGKHHALGGVGARHALRDTALFQCGRGAAPAEPSARTTGRKAISFP